MTKTKTLNKTHMIRNIRGLSVGDRAYCGPYGTIRCTSKAIRIAGKNFKRNTRKFSVSGNTNGVLQNRGNYTMAQLRLAICH